MVFQCDGLDAAGLCQICRLAPEVNRNAPLIIENVHHLRWERVGYPVQCGVVRCTCRKTRLCNNVLDAEQLCQTECVHNVRCVACPTLARANRIGGAVEGIQLEAAALNGVHKVLTRVCAVQQLLHVQMRRTGVTAGCDLEHLNAHLDRFVQHLLERHIRQTVCKQAQLHRIRIKGCHRHIKIFWIYTHFLYPPNQNAIQAESLSADSTHLSTHLTPSTPA